MTGTEVGCVAAVAVSALAYFGTLDLLGRMGVSGELPFWVHALLCSLALALRLAEA